MTKNHTLQITMATVYLNWYFVVDKESYSLIKKSDFFFELEVLLALFAYVALEFPQLASHWNEVRAVYTIVGSVYFTETNMEKLEAWTRMWPWWYTPLSIVYYKLFILGTPVKVENVEFIKCNVDFRNLSGLHYDSLSFKIYNDCLIMKVNS